MTHRQERGPQDGPELLRLARGCTYFYTRIMAGLGLQGGRIMAGLELQGGGIMGGLWPQGARIMAGLGQGGGIRPRWTSW